MSPTIGHNLETLYHELASPCPSASDAVSITPRWRRSAHGLALALSQRIRTTYPTKIFRSPIGRNPTGDFMPSMGKEILNPATLTAGTPVTIVGEVAGAMAGKTGDSEYRYPTVLIRLNEMGQTRRSVSISRTMDIPMEALYLSEAVFLSVRRTLAAISRQHSAISFSGGLRPES